MGPQNSIRVIKVAPVSRSKKVERTDTMMSTRGSMLETAVVGPREPRLPRRLWPDLGGRLKGDLGLMSSCCEGHEDSQQPNVPFDGIAGMVTMIVKIWTDPYPTNGPPDCI